jgi:hypothetical protein
MSSPISINNLSVASTVAGADAFVIYKNSQGDSRRTSVTDVQAYMQANLTFTDSTAQESFTTQYSTPLTGATVAIVPTTSNAHLIITPAGTISTLTLTLPLASGVSDKQEVLVNSTQIVTTLTVSSNGASAVLGEPSTLAANGFFRLKYDSLMATWYRVG